MIDLDTQLRAYFDAVDPAFAIDDLMVEPEVEPQPAPGGFPKRGLAIALGAALVAVLLIGLPILLIGGGDEAVVDEPTTTLSPTTTLPPTTVAPMIESWQRVGAEVLSPAVGLFAMTETTNGLVAVGFDPGEDNRQNGAIFLSSDGVEWSRLAEDDPALTLGAVLMYGVAEGPSGLVAVGMGCEDDAAPCPPHPTVWTSVDGASWARSSADVAVFGESGAMTDVLATEAGLYAIGGTAIIEGEDVYLVQPTVWHSVDAAEWARVWEGVPVDVGKFAGIAGFQSLAATPDGHFVAVGTGLNSSDEPVAAVWASLDGTVWDRVDPDARAFRVGTSMFGVTHGIGGFVAVGTDEGAEPAIWRSEDGRAWTRVDTSQMPFDTIGTLSAVAALDGGYVAAGPHGFDDPRGGWVTLWTSPDGLTWDRVETMGDGYAMALVATETGIAVAGGMPGVDNVYAAVWAGPTFDPAAPPPDPQPPVPSESDEAVDDPTGIGALEAGFTCEELVEGGFLYPEVVSYWLRFEAPGDLDPDDNGIPCEDAYSSEEVAAVYGPTEGLWVRMVGQHTTATFAAEGPAVDAGLVCAEGTISYTEDPESGPDVLWRWEDLYTCDDGSGTFLLGVDEYIDDSTGMWGVWNIVEGTGAYETLRGGGGTDSVFGGYDASNGRLYLDS